MRRPRVACGSCLKTEHSECSVTQLNSRGKKEKKKACRHTHTHTDTDKHTATKRAAVDGDKSDEAADGSTDGRGRAREWSGVGCCAVLGFLP